jgi:hypothetical protein
MVADSLMFLRTEGSATGAAVFSGLYVCMFLEKKPQGLPMRVSFLS